MKRYSVTYNVRKACEGVCPHNGSWPQTWEVEADDIGHALTVARLEHIGPAGLEAVYPRSVNEIGELDDRK